MLRKEKTGFGNLISGRLERSEMEDQGEKKKGHFELLQRELAIRARMIIMEVQGKCPQ